MTQEERLIELIKRSVDEFIKNVMQHCVENDLEMLPSVEKHIAGDLLANGVIVPPVKVGDTVYMPWEFDDNKGIAILEVVGISFHNEYGFIKTNLFSDCDEYLSRYNYGKFGFSDLGETVFLTKEEAEAASKEREVKS